MYRGSVWVELHQIRTHKVSKPKGVGGGVDLGENKKSDSCQTPKNLLDVCTQVFSVTHYCLP
jgi:hypothetical protein